jgi:hypothetical protein
MRDTKTTISRSWSPLKYMALFNDTVIEDFRANDAAGRDDDWTGYTCVPRNSGLLKACAG